MEDPMNEIVTSLKKFKLTHDIKKIISSIDPANKSNNISAVLRKYYSEDLIGETEYLTLETKILLTRFCLLLERKYPDLMCGVYLYDMEDNKMWNGAVPNIPNGYSDYSNGVSVEDDIQTGEIIPAQMKTVLAVHDIEKAEDLTSLNHKSDLIKNGIYAYCATPLTYNGSLIGHTALFSDHKRKFSNKELVQYTLYNRLIEENLVQRKDQLLRVIKKTKLA